MSAIVASILISAILAALLVTVSLLYARATINGKRIRAQLAGLRDALEEQERILRAVLDTVPAAINLKDERGRYRFVNKGLADLYGATPEEAVALWNRVQDEAGTEGIGKVALPDDPYDYSISAAEDRQVLETGVRTDFADTHYDIDGRREIWSASKLPLVDSRTGVRYVLTVSFDETRERDIEETLRQAQKMEAIGQLTGGIAHDFNNLLTVVIGNLELLLESPDSQHRDEHIRSALEAAERGAGLTQRLLAFARQQPLNPVSMDLNESVRGMHGLIAHTLGAQIEIEIAAADELWRCIADRSQVENAILNLAINAHDAMPDGGKLTLETANARIDEDGAAQIEVTPGEYAVIAVTDNGSGMTEEEKRKAFEPFFTTKGPGKGSGLGLAMVYGFVKQSGGHVKIYSEVGLGTSVKIYLPRSREERQCARPEEPSDALPHGNGQLILVVEDDANVRVLAVTLLHGLGYRVLEADSGPAALALMEQPQRVDLLLTDVALPGGMNGRQLSETLLQRLPGLRTLFMSGYAANAIIHHGRVDPGVQLLQKPFRKKDLARAVRRALES